MRIEWHLWHGMVSKDFFAQKALVLGKLVSKQNWKQELKF